jgi:hypothetical protein
VPPVRVRPVPVGPALARLTPEWLAAVRPTLVTRVLLIPGLPTRGRLITVPLTQCAIPTILTARA